MATKLGKVVTYYEELLPIMSQNVLNKVMWDQLIN